MDPKKPDIKPGFKTTEFYVTGGTIISAVTVALAAQGTPEKIAAWAAAAGAILAYIYTRYAMKAPQAAAEELKAPPVP